MIVVLVLLFIALIVGLVFGVRRRKVKRTYEVSPLKLNGRTATSSGKKLDSMKQEEEMVVRKAVFDKDCAAVMKFV